MPVEIKNLNINVKIKYDQNDSATAKASQGKTLSQEKLIETIQETLRNLKER